MARKKECQTCNGKGKVLNPGASGFGWKDCPDCNGTGKA